MELLTTKQLNLIAEGDMKGFLKDFQANPPTGISDKNSQAILDGLQRMGLITPSQAKIQQANDFILRPGEAPVKFNEGDIILGGTNLDGGQGDITNRINNVNNNVSTNTVGQRQTEPIELTGTLTVKGEGENATVNVKRLLAQLSSGDLQNLSMMLSNATA